MKSYRYYYTRHCRDARSRGIPFLLTIDEWITVWTNSGHYHERGRCRGQYVMARYGDKGPYALGNVRIVPQEENHREAHLGKVMSAESRSKMAASGRVKVFTESHRANIGLASLGKKYRLGIPTTDEAKAKISVALRGRKRTPEVRARMADAARRRWASARASE